MNHRFLGAGWRKGIASAVLAVAGALALTMFVGQSGSAQSYTAPYYPVPVIEAVAGEDNAFRLKIMRCAKSSADSAESSAAACSSSELTQAAEYRALFTVQIEGEAGGLIWADHATRPSWNGSLCTNQSGRTPASSCTTTDGHMRQADQASGNRAGTAAVVPELFRFAPPPGRSSMTITVKLPAQNQHSWANRVRKRSGGLVVRDLNPPFYPLNDDALTTTTRTLSFTESMAEASLLSDAGGTAWDFVRVNGQSRFWARDALYFKIGVSDDYMVNQATITVTGPTGSFIKPAPSESGRAAFEADCTARAAGAAMNSCELTPVSIVGFPAGQLTHNPPSGLERRERLMLFSPPPSGSGTATITVSTARPQGPSHTVTDTATISIRYAETVPSNLGYAYPVPKLAQDFTSAERDTYAQVMSLGTYQSPHIRWEQEPFSNAQVKVGDRLLTAFVGIDARTGNELELVGGPGETPEPTNVFDSYLPWWVDETAAPGDAGLCPAGASGRYAYAPCRDSNTMRVQGAASPTTDDVVITRQTARADGKTFWSIPQQDGSGYPLPASVPTSPGRATTFGLQELRSPGDGSGVKLVARAATGTVTMSASRQPIGGSASAPAFHWEYDGDRNSFLNDGDMIEVAAGLQTTFTVPAGRTLEAACMTYWSLATVAQSSQSLLRTHVNNLVEQRMWRFANVSGLYDLDYYQQFYGFTAGSQPTQPATGTTPRHPFCTNWAIEGRYNVMRHQRYLAVGNTAEITTSALTSGSAGDRHQLALPTWSTGSRHIFVAVPDSMGEVLSLELAGGTTLAGSTLTRLPDRVISGTTFKVWVSTGTVPQTASGTTATIVQQSPSILVIEGPAYWRTAEAVADPTKRSQVLQVGYGTPYELLNCERPPQSSGDMHCKLVDLYANPPQMVLDTTQSTSGAINVRGRLHGIRGNSIQVAWGLAGSDWQGSNAAVLAGGAQNLVAAEGEISEAVELFKDAGGSAGAISLAASLADDADQVLQETDDRALKIGPTATVTPPSGLDLTIGCIQTFGSGPPGTVTWMRTGANPGEAPACAYDDLLNGRDSYLTIDGPATWKAGGKRLPIGTGTDFPVVQCDDPTDADGDGDWLVSCAVKNNAGEYPRLVVDAGAADGSTIKIVANFSQAGTAPERGGWRVSWREGTDGTPSSGWGVAPPAAERETDLFTTVSFPVRDIDGIGSIVLERGGGRTLPAPVNWNEGLLLRVRNGEGNPAESEDVSSISLVTTDGLLNSDWCEAGTTGCAFDMPAWRSKALETPALSGAIPVELRTPGEPGTVTVTAAVVSATSEPFEYELDVPVRGPADSVVVGHEETPPSVHHHATPNDDRDVIKFDERAFDRLTQGTGFPDPTELRVYDPEGVRASRGFALSEECPTSDRLSCQAVVRVIAPASNPLPTGRYRLEATDGAGRSDQVEFLVVAGAARIEAVGQPWRGVDVGEQFELAVLVTDESGLPVADGTPTWFAVRSRFPNDAKRGREGWPATLGHPRAGDTVQTLGGKAAAQMTVTGEEVALTTASAGGAYPTAEAFRTIVVYAGAAGCDGDFVAEAVRVAASFDDGLLTRWDGADGCPASEVRSLLDDGWRIYLYTDPALRRDWPYYAEQDGLPVPGSTDFWLVGGDLFWAVPPPG